MSVADPLIGVRIGNYQVVSLLGEGGMARVYRATHPEIGRDVAVKVLSEMVAAVPDVVRRFKIEAQAVNKIDHPNIIRIFDYGALADGRPFYVMELLNGESLADHIRRVGSLTLVEALAITDAVLDALDAVHRANVVHRDLKPDNVFLSRSGVRTEIKLLDFGIIKILDDGGFDKTRTGSLLGTPSYMAPEQCEGRQKDIGPKTDLYAVGCMLYQMLSGVVPFDAESLGGLLLQHMTQPPLPLTQRTRGLPPGLSELVDSCLAKHPAQRPASAAWLRDQLKAFQSRTHPVAETIAMIVPGHASPTIAGSSPALAPLAGVVPPTLAPDAQSVASPPGALLIDRAAIAPSNNRASKRLAIAAGGVLAAAAALIVFVLTRGGDAPAGTDVVGDAAIDTAPLDAAPDAPPAPPPDAPLDAPVAPPDAMTLKDRLRALENMCRDHAFPADECAERRKQIIEEFTNGRR